MCATVFQTNGLPRVPESEITCCCGPLLLESFVVEVCGGEITFYCHPNNVNTVAVFSIKLFSTLVGSDSEITRCCVAPVQTVFVGGRQPG